ncbi:hypothetical protein COT97_00825 [Candidatus Falkowbacteria bacterium CG10_big_fil_rev_8_21_14_0_10_39_11]|uniref:PrgI family protein n=1 Tax=Candidatus Falkowbacteria bacterium CG10_big_fil_rev_8_21_14_0_10_39_11 TaxID=1974565 RepID=A0A2H0V635_9BACT|nr:MAG: hypothetical protein COT97_00825 [Candidatus Falkowbacteria bacterium CG10_big_fil_rev_8_21_14_0_10_39_11]
MPNQFIVPQFIDVEDKILGPITIRQFGIMVVALVIGAIEFRLVSFVAFIPLAIITVGIAAIFAFAKVNGRPIHFFFLSFLQTLRRPNQRVWNKAAYVVGVQEVKADHEIIHEEEAHKEAVSESRLHDLSLLINTGGVYQTDEDFFADQVVEGQIQSKKTLNQKNNNTK